MILSLQLFNHDYFQTGTLLQSLINGLSNGVLYSFLAVALVLVYRTSSQLNFAQGEMATVGAFLTFQLTVWFGVNIWIAIPVAMVLMAVLGALSWRVLLQPMRKNTAHAPLIILLALFMLFNSGSAVFWGTSNRSGLAPLPNGLADQIQLRSGVPAVYVTYASIGGFILLMAVFTVIQLMMKRTRLGLSYRALASNPESAGYLGIDLGRLVTLGWGIAAGVGVLVGVLFSQQANLLYSNLMLNPLLFAFAAAALGGFDSLVGAIVGGLLVGLFEATIPSAFSFIGSELNVAVALAVIFLVLLFKPSGLFGSEKVTRS